MCNAKREGSLFRINIRNANTGPNFEFIDNSWKRPLIYHEPTTAPSDLRLGLLVSRLRLCILYKSASHWIRIESVVKLHPRRVIHPVDQSMVVAL